MVGRFSPSGRVRRRQRYMLRTRTRSSVLMGTSWVWDEVCGGWAGDGSMGSCGSWFTE